MVCKKRSIPLRFLFVAPLVALTALSPVRAAEEATKRDDTAAERLGWRLAIQCWTFRAKTLFETIDIAKKLGVRYLELYPGQRLSPERDVQVGPGLSKEDRDALKAKLKEADIRATNYGVTGAGKAEFEFARDLGIETITAEPGEGEMAAIDKLCGEYGINVSIHNHPQPSHYWNPETVLKALPGISRRIGACADTGHWMRSGLNPIECLKKLEGHIVAFHFKDLDKMGDGRDVPWGTGAGDVKGMLTEIRRQGFTGVFSIEYEFESPTLTEEVGQCVANFDKLCAELVKQTPAETGAVTLFNGKDLTGWATSAANVRGVFGVKGGVITDKGRPTGYLRTTQDYTNFILRLQLRHLSPGNGGVLVRMVGKDKVWPKCVECQGMFGSVGDIFTIDEFPVRSAPRSQGRYTPRLESAVERPMGEWSNYEITLDGGELIVKLNGAVVNSLTDVQEVPGKILLQAEGAQMEYRNIRLIPLEPRGQAADRSFIRRR